MQILLLGFYDRDAPSPIATKNKLDAINENARTKFFQKQGPNYRNFS